MRPFATQKPTRPMGLRQLGHGISNKLHNAAATTAAINTEKTNRTTNPLGPLLTKIPDMRRKATVAVTDRPQRRIKYRRMVMATGLLVARHRYERLGKDLRSSAVSASNAVCVDSKSTSIFLVLASYLTYISWKYGFS